MQEYYNRRAAEYEEKYHRDEPVRQTEQDAMAGVIRDAFAGHRVLEIACGTGFWTAVVAEVALHIVATDTSPEMLAIAESKGLPPERVEFRAADAYDLAAVEGQFNSVLANFWFSHVPKARIEPFLETVHSRVGPGALVFMADDMYLPGVGGEFIERPGSLDTFKKRKLLDGSEYEIIKNYYDEASLRATFGPHSRDLHIHIGAYFWWVVYTVRG